jgi:hypothetical protein
MQKIVIALIAVCCAVAATGCTGLMGNSLSGSATQRVDYAEGSPWQGIAAEKSAGAYTTVVPTFAPAPYGSGSAGSIETKIIKTAQITVEVRDVVTSADGLKALATRNGGYLSSSSFQRGYNNQLSATVVLRIPQSAFDAVVEGVKASGTVKSASTQGEDVTEEYVDLQAQKTSYQNQLAQYNEIMKKADKVEDVIKVQAQIDQVQTTLNRLEGRMRYLNSRIDLSTITVNLQEPEPVGGETGHSFIAAINEGIAGFFGMIDGIIVLLFTLLPLIIIGGIGYGIYRWRKEGKKAEPATPPESGDKR